eukprot:1622664-Rhodomonas_salina.1
MTTRDSVSTEPARGSALVLDSARGSQLTQLLAITECDQLVSGDDECDSPLELDHTRVSVSSSLGGRLISLSTANQMIASPNQDSDDQTRQHRRKRGARKKQMQ